MIIKGQVLKKAEKNKSTSRCRKEDESGNGPGLRKISLFGWNDTDERIESKTGNIQTQGIQARRGQ